MHCCSSATPSIQVSPSLNVLSSYCLISTNTYSHGPPYTSIPEVDCEMIRNETYLKGHRQTCPWQVKCHFSLILISWNSTPKGNAFSPNSNWSRVSEQRQDVGFPHWVNVFRAWHQPIYALFFLIQFVKQTLHLTQGVITSIAKTANQRKVQGFQT